MIERALIVAALAGGCVVGGDREAPPVQLAAGAPKPFAEAVESGGGQTFAVMRHDVCIAVDTQGGYILPVSLSGPGFLSLPDTGAPVNDAPIDGIDCPTGDPWRGWARIGWDTVGGRGRVVLTHSLTRRTGSGTVPGDGGDSEIMPDAEFTFRADIASGPVPSGGELLFQGEAFPGFTTDVTADASNGPLTLGFTLEFAASATVPAAPAAFVAITPTTVPSGLASAVLPDSPGWDPNTGTVTTDAHGTATLLVDPSTLCEDGIDKTLFVATPDGGIQLATTISCSF
jgi:hypothetical protein